MATQAIGGARVLPFVRLRAAVVVALLAPTFVEGQPEARAQTESGISGPIVPERIISITTNSIGMKLARVPAGEFWMGSHESAEAAAEAFDSLPTYYADEYPPHQVRITRPFQMGIHEVTVGQFRAFVQATNYKTRAEKKGRGGWGYDGRADKFRYGWDENADRRKFKDGRRKYYWDHVGWPQTEDHPVVNVNWRDAEAFCGWLSQKEGKTYRLPTEAEWEYACRAGTSSRYHGGDDPESLVAVGNVADASAKREFPDWTTTRSDDGYVFTAPVGQFEANAFGLYDMHGNVWEWCRDWYDEDYYAKSPATDPPGPAKGDVRVLRGGGWWGKPEFCRSSYRVGSPTFRYGGAGFRVVFVAE